MNITRLTILTNSLLIALGIFFYDTSISLIIIISLSLISLIYFYKYIRKYSIVIWRIYFKLYGRRLFLLSLPILIIFIILLQTNMGLYHTQFIQSEQFNQTNFPNGHFLVQENFHLSQNNLSELEQIFNEPPVISFKQQYPDLNIETNVLDYIPINVNFTANFPNDPNFGSNALIIPLDSNLTSQIWQNNIPLDINNSGFVFPIYGTFTPGTIDNQGYSNIGIADARKGLVSITANNNFEQINIHTIPLSNITGFPMREIINSLAIPKNFMANEIILAKPSTILQWFSNKPVLAYLSQIIFRIKLWVLSYSLIVSNSTIISSINNELINSQLTIIQNNIQPLVLELKPYDIQLQTLSNGIDYILFFILTAIYLTLFWDYQTVIERFFTQTHFSKGNHTNLHLKKNTVFLEEIIIHFPFLTLFVVILISIPFNNLNILGIKINILILTFSEILTFLGLIHIMSYLFYPRNNNLGIRAQMQKGLDQNQKFLVMIWVLLAIFYFNIDWFVNLTSDLQSLQYIFYLMLMLLTGIILLINGSELLKYLLRIHLFILKFVGKGIFYKNRYLLIIQNSIKRWIFYSNNYRHLIISFTFLSALTIATLLGASFYEQENLDTSKIELGGNLLVTGFNNINSSNNFNLSNEPNVLTTVQYDYITFSDSALTTENGMPLKIQLLGVSNLILNKYYYKFSSPEIPTESSLKSLFSTNISAIVYKTSPIKNFASIGLLKAKNPYNFGLNYIPFPISITGQVKEFPGSGIFNSNINSSLCLITTLDHFQEFFNTSTQIFQPEIFIGVLTNSEYSVYSVRDTIYSDFNNNTNLLVNNSLTPSQFWSSSNPGFVIVDAFSFLSIDSGIVLFFIILYGLFSMFLVINNEINDNYGSLSLRLHKLKINIVIDIILYVYLFIPISFLFQLILLSYIINLVSIKSYLFLYSPFNYLNLTIISIGIIIIILIWFIKRFSLKEEGVI